jgi:transcriptional regulator with GAF, ATPase, and Fis domain
VTPDGNSQGKNKRDGKGGNSQPLRDCNWVMAKAARKLGITERMIGYKIRKHGLRIKEVWWIEGVERV